MDIRSLTTAVSVLTDRINFEEARNAERMDSEEYYPPFNVSPLYQAKASLQNMIDEAMKNDQDKMDFLTGEVIFYDLDRTTPPVMSAEDREFAAQGFDNLAKQAEEAEAKGETHMFAPQYSRHLAALARSNFTLQR